MKQKFHFTLISNKLCPNKQTDEPIGPNFVVKTDITLRKFYC